MSETTPKKAWALYEQALGLFADIGDLRNEAIIQLNLGVVAVERGAYDQAGALLESATANARIVGDTGTVAAALMEHAGAVFKRGETVRRDVAYRKRSSRRYDSARARS